MSHVATVQVEIRDLAALEAAAQRCGLEFVRGQRTYEWYGRHMGDYPVPEGMTINDLGKCDHALRIPDQPGSYEVGVRALPDGRFVLAWDFIDHGLAKRMGGERADKFRQAYATEVALRKARAMGFAVTENVKADGTINLVCRR